MGLAKLYKRGGLTKAQWALLCRISDSDVSVALYGGEIRTATILFYSGLMNFADGRAWYSPKGRKLVEDVRRIHGE